MIIYLCLLPRVQVYQTIQSDRVDALEQPHDGSPGVFVSQGINQHGLKDLSSRQRNYSAEKAYGLPTSTSHHDSVQNERTRNTGNGNTSIVFVSQNVPPSKRRKLQEKIDEIFVTTGQPYDGNLWEISDYMPQWMQGKMRWK